MRREKKRGEKTRGEKSEKRDDDVTNTHARKVRREMVMSEG